MSRKAVKEKYEYNTKKDLEHIVRKNLMSLVANAGADNREDRENELWNKWLEESASPIEGMCVGWSFMFIEDEDLTREIWENLDCKELPSLKKETQKLYQEYGRKLWYRYTHTTDELEEKSNKREFAKCPLKSDKSDFQIAASKIEHTCKGVNNAKDDNESYELLMEAIIKIIENQTDKKKRHYLKIDNNSHSMVIAFNAFESNKSKVAMETNCNGIEDIESDNYKKALREILSGAFGKDVVRSKFSIEGFSRSLEDIKSPSTEVRSPTVSIFSQQAGKKGNAHNSFDFSL